MKVLLDTNALLWWAHGHRKMSRKGLAALDAADFIGVSVVSYWEIGIKRSGKGFDFAVSAKWEELIPQFLSRYGVELLQIKVSHCKMIEGLPHHHGDPFDRLLIAQAIEAGLTVVGSDDRFERYGVTRVW